MRRIVFALLPLVLSSGCAYMINGTHQTVGVSSSPSGVQFTVDGMTHTTPAMVKMKRDRDHIVVFEKAGYQNASGTIASEFDPLIFANILWVYGAPIGFGIDIKTGASYELKPNTVHVTLQEEKP